MQKLECSVYHRNAANCEINGTNGFGSPAGDYQRYLIVNLFELFDERATGKTCPTERTFFDYPKRGAPLVQNSRTLNNVANKGEECNFIAAGATLIYAKKYRHSRLFSTYVSRVSREKGRVCLQQ